MFGGILALKIIAEEAVKAREDARKHFLAMDTCSEQEAVAHAEVIRALDEKMKSNLAWPRLSDLEKVLMQKIVAARERDRTSKK